MRWINKGHEFDSVGHLLENKDCIYIYGAGQIGTELCQTLMPLLKWLNWEIAFVDASIEKQRTGLCGFNVICPSVLKNVDKTKSFVVVCASEKNISVMTETAISAGFINRENLFDHYYFLYTYLSVHFLYNFDMVYISSLNIVPSTICNLNCKGCLNFNPFMKKHTTYDLDFLFTDVDALFSAIDIIGRFQITGGEPLLYPKLSELITYIGTNYREKISRFELVTNGTVIPSDNICLCAKKYDMYIIVDDYRNTVEAANKNYKYVINKFKSYKLQVLENYVPQWFDLTPNINTPRKSTERELVNWFTACENPYATIYNKSISACNYAHYAAKAGIVENNVNDYFDLTKPFTKRELIEYRLRFNNRGYTELCKYCAKYRFNNNWIKSAVQLNRNGESL